MIDPFHRLHKILNKTKYNNCAIVRHKPFHKVGHIIDQADIVIRLNLDPIFGYEAHVGTKTSLRIMEAPAIGCALMERGCIMGKNNNYSFCPKYAVFLNTANKNIHTAFSHACNDTMLISYDDIESYFSYNLFSKYYTTELLAMMFATNLCSSRTIAYGFTSERYSTLQNIMNNTQIDTFGIQIWSNDTHLNFSNTLNQHQTHDTFVDALHYSKNLSIYYNIPPFYMHRPIYTCSTLFWITVPNSFPHTIFIGIILSCFILCIAKIQKLRGKKHPYYNENLKRHEQGRSETEMRNRDEKIAVY
tara:strand:+ start:929 stop:1837 length:909 start_codon:yes stop_codon:yes gene_type:complete